MNTKYLLTVLILLLGVVASNPSRAQITFSEDFTGANTSKQLVLLQRRLPHGGIDGAGFESRRHTGVREYFEFLLQPKPSSIEYQRSCLW